MNVQAVSTAVCITVPTSLDHTLAPVTQAISLVKMDISVMVSENIFMLLNIYDTL